MGKETNRASVFLFTSYQGGVGKSSLALSFAKALRSHRETGKVALIEFNMFTPSFLMSSVMPIDEVKSSLFDCFAGDFYALRAEDLEGLFYLQDDLLCIPFCGNRQTGTLAPSFNFAETELCPLMGKVLKLLGELDYGIVIDVPLNMGPLAMYLLNKSDCIYYVFSSEAPSPQFAKQFDQELSSRPHLKDKVVWLHNLIDPEMGDESRFFNQEVSIPISSDLTGNGDTGSLDQMVGDLAEEASKKEAGDHGDADSDASKELEIPEELLLYQKELRSDIVAGLEKRFDLSDHELRRRVERKIENALAKRPPPEIDGIDARGWTKKTLIDGILGLGPLEEFMRDAEVDEIMVNGPDRIFVEKRGKLQLTTKTFNSAEHVRTVIDRILMPVGRTVNERTPYVDARLADGSRVHAIIPPLSITGPMITIRRFSRTPYTLADLVFRFKTLTPEAGEFLKLAVKMKMNIVVSGGASSGKTTLLNVLSSFILPGERVICIEDSAELQLDLENLGRLEARQKGTEAKNAVTIRDLVRNSLRMRPDRVIVGECRGAEALDMLQAMNTGHDGSLTTLHANSSRDALARLETMVLMAGVDLPLRAIREQIASSVNMVIQSSRLADGTRKLTEIAEVVGIEDTSIKVQPIFKFEQKWIGEDGRVFGELKPTGIIPSFMKSIPGNLVEQSAKLFQTNQEAEK